MVDWNNKQNPPTRINLQMDENKCQLKNDVFKLFNMSANGSWFFVMMMHGLSMA